MLASDIFATGSRSGLLWRQNPAELESFLNLVRRLGVRRYLEIGANNGDTFAAVMDAALPDAFGMAIDEPWDDRAARHLASRVAEYDGELVRGKSSSQVSIRAARAAAPFDLILIDADHTFAGVRADWLNYGALAPVVVFHDIAAPAGHLSSGQPIGVPQLWNNLATCHRTEEFIAPGSRMGFGVLYREDANAIHAR